jgi:hypothetical protein
MYSISNGAATPLYNFRKDFDSIARPGLVRYLEHFGLAVGPEEGEDPADFDLMDSGDEAREYLRQLRGGLEEAQESLEDSVPLVLYPDIVTWSRESAIALTNRRLDDMLGATDTGPVDLFRAVRLGSEMARKLGLDVGPEAVAYAADRLKSNIERDAVYNPVTEVHAGILAHRFLKEQRGGEVVYIDEYRLRRERAEVESQEQPKQEERQAKQEQPRQERADGARQEQRGRGGAKPKFALT